jgi:type I restriction enzyme S subunit
MNAIPSGYKQTEVGLIPEEWEVMAVRQMGEVLTGKALAVQGPGRQRPYLRTKNVFDGRIEIEDVLTMPMTDEQFARFRIRNGDVLLNEGQSLELVGRCSLYSDEYPEPCAMQNQLLRFRARSGVSPVFASYLFRRCQESGVFARIALQTTSIAHLGGSRFERLRLAWPKSEPEQRAIAEALSEVDGLLGGLDRLIAKKRDLKQAAMQQLLTGQARLPGFHGEWEEKTFSAVLVRLNAKAYQIQTSDYRLSGRYPVVDQGKEAVIGFSDKEDKRLRCPDGGVIVFGDHTCVVKFIDFDFLVGADGTQVLQARAGQSTRFHALQLQYRGIEPTGYNRHFKFLMEREFISPPLPEQTAIAAVLSDLDAELAALEQRREKTRALKQAMMQELLTGRIRLK